MECLEKYGSALPVDETFKTKWLSDRVYILLNKIKESDERYHHDSSDGEVPELLNGFCNICVWFY
jgi:hypothetical protein